MSDTAHWHILGAGSIGGLWAARLHQAERAPVVILKSQRLADYHLAGGLQIEGEGQVDVAAVSPQMLTSPIDHLLVCCKTTQTLPALASIKHAIHAGTLIVLVQNGMGTDEAVRAAFPDNIVLCGTTTAGAHRAIAFHIIPAGTGPTDIGPTSPGDDSYRPVVESLSCPGFPVIYQASMAPLLWRKLAINCAINPLTVRYQCRNGELLDISDAKADLASLCREIELVGRAAGFGESLQNLEAVVLDVARKTASNSSSMLQDVRAGRTTEIDSISGYLCRVARSHGIPAPLNEALYAEISALAPSPQGSP